MTVPLLANVAHKAFDPGSCVFEFLALVLASREHAKGRLEWETRNVELRGCLMPYVPRGRGVWCRPTRCLIVVEDSWGYVFGGYMGSSMQVRWLGGALRLSL